ncbi:4-hydroxy-tetrahydrodipicolinate synthase [Methanothrix soehngenii]|jgi:4-hydroxy-tetrahydrodipicolinate synthase|uniref:4-hydroxy-tetrahydrodipicolinate synthase n=1 Tax=Methanothrix soehngenii TaxID=2223 RepID=UPI0023F34D30|nr:4-hydroxy-tetrahydrodipicolinate synthase [Methanothrix soehngenii]MCK9585614.1 4-hydroxy-tetrahydrodipicolinate synthase [Methanothrix soehngenii]MDD4487456.1 4-hydroxy-tetrahydrodipicolinate synthase [Methanothrix soehngenii]MDD5256230.1 4-hydroxy-tetrahydrodipicolinate synthase [Methanothrix soehngenii]MDD5734426.1 4-hydroxy-tetrahydrodipicolinate synthase [Methanothrix soehngenii]HOG97409.1 4-hydroxy-tetrahydrodipicolinate synthase [Methanothrix soehngenii]
MYSGVLPAIITPFHEDKSLDEEGLKRNVEYLSKTGIAGMVPCGTTGEAATLTFEEHKRVIEIAVENSTVPVIAGTGSNNTREAVELTCHAAEAGADAALLITPYYNKPNDRGMFEHFKTVAEKCDIPIVLYNVPKRTGIDLKPELVAKLSRIKNIVAIKEASGSLSQLSQIIEQTRGSDFSVLCGDDDLTLPAMALGAKGVISVVANVAPRKTVAMVDAMMKGDLEKARSLHYELAPLVRAMFLETNPIPVKTAHKYLGLAGGPLRLPLGEMAADKEKMLKELLVTLGERA